MISWVMSFLASGDASDDHVMDLAVACGVQHLVTHNLRDFQRGELHFSLPEVVTPLQHLEKIDENHSLSLR